MAFLHPKAAGGVLTELVEPAGDPETDPDSEEEAMAEEFKRVEVGFGGGQVMTVRISDPAFAQLRSAVERDEGGTTSRPRMDPSGSTSPR